MSALVLTGCTTSAPLTERPALVWQDGEPTGPLEANPWVQALRTSDLEGQIASATLDFTTPALYESSDLDLIASRRWMLETAARSEEWAYPPGPTPMIPVHVEESSDGDSAKVTICRASDWLISAEHPAPPTRLRGHLARINETLKDGHRLVDTGGLIPDAETANRVLGADVAAPFLSDDVERDGVCTLKDAAVGLFDPQPDVTVEYSVEDIKRPGDDG
jgi:hypothetical protein